MPATIATTTGTDDDSQLDVTLLRELAKQNLVDLLNSVSGAKTVVLDNSISGPLSLLTEVSLLRDHGVSKIFWLETTPPSAPTKSLFYLLRPTIRNIKLVSAHIKAHQAKKEEYSYKLLFSPRSSTLTNTILEQEGVLGSVEVESWDMGFIPLESDVISLERDSAFRELWVDEDPSPIHVSLFPLVTLNKLFGPIPRIIGKGKCANRLAKMFINHMQYSDDSDSRSGVGGRAGAGSIDALIILDRKVDMITPLLTQLTYEGLMDEVLRIQNSHVEIPTSLLAPTNTQTPSTSTPAVMTTTTTEKPKKHHLSSQTDPLLPQLRNLNFSSIGKQLSRTAHRLDHDYKSRLEAKTVSQLKDFVGKLGGLQSEHQALKLRQYSTSPSPNYGRRCQLLSHMSDTGLTELINPHTRTEVFNTSLEIQQNLLASYSPATQASSIEELISIGAPLNTILRLICLASLTSSGIKTKTLESLKREILQTYGYKFLPALITLGSSPLNLITPSPLPPGSSPFPHSQLRKSLRLLIDPEEIPARGSSEEDNDEQDVSYVFSGWAPLSVRLVQCVAQKGGVLANPNQGISKTSSNQEEIQIKTPAQPISGWKGFEEVVEIIPGETFDMVLPPTLISRNPSHQLQTKRDAPTTTIVFFLGGITYAEIAALRWVARQNRGRRYLIATTSIVSGNSIMDSITGSTSGPTEDS